MKILSIVLVVAGFLAVACTSYRDRVAGTCSRDGYSPGTALFLQCVQGEEANDEASRANYNAMTGNGIAMMQHHPHYCASVGNGVMCN